LLNGNKKAYRNKISWAANVGLKPLSKINYQIESLGRLPGIDSLSTVYEGNGGVNQAFIGTAVKIKNFSIGINFGYLFGNKNYDTRLEFINDSVNYLKSSSQTNTNFGGIFMNAGVQYVAPIDKKSFVRFGAYGNFSQKYNASQNIIRESYVYTSTGATNRLDSVSSNSDLKGKIQLPATFGGGIAYENTHILVGVDFETSSWSQYKFYGASDALKDSWIMKGGFQYYGASTTSRKYWDFVKVRGGVFIGNDYISVDNSLPLYGVTLGGGFPLKLNRTFYETQYSVLNVALEYGSRGNKNNNIKENIFRFSLGFSLSDIWFKRYKYD